MAGGSILLAHNPPKWVNFARRFTALADHAAKLERRLAPETVRAIIGTPDLAEAMGAMAGEVFVIRPDGLVLARLSDLARLASVADHLRSGSAPAKGDAPQVNPKAAVSSDEEQRESVWIALSDALDQADDREAFLTRLALLLGSRTDPDMFRQEVATALEPMRTSEQPG